MNGVLSVTVENRAFNQNTDAAIIPAPLSLNFSMSFNLNEQSNARNLAAQCCQASVTEIALLELLRPKSQGEPTRPLFLSLGLTLSEKKKIRGMKRTITEEGKKIKINK